VPFEQHLAVIRLLKPGKDAQCGGFSASGWTQQSEELVVPDIKRDVAQHPHIAIRFVHSHKLDQMGGSGFVLQQLMRCRGPVPGRRGRAVGVGGSEGCDALDE